MIRARYRHTCLVARDWRKLADFYREVFGCRERAPERHLTGAWLDAGTGLRDTRIDGVHLALPGWSGDGPTLEIFQYSPALPSQEPAANRPGFSHIAFSVEDVDAAWTDVLAAGGRALGKTTRFGRLTFVYVADPEGNVIELQHWAQTGS